MFVSAIWGTWTINGKPEGVQNYHIGEHDTAEDAAKRVTANCAYLAACGYEWDGNYTDAAGVFVHKFKKNEETRQTGYWHQPAPDATRNPGHCEAAYLSVE